MSFRRNLSSLIADFNTLSTTTPNLSSDLQKLNKIPPRYFFCAYSLKTGNHIVMKDPVNFVDHTSQQPCRHIFDKKNIQQYFCGQEPKARFIRFIRRSINILCQKFTKVMCPEFLENPNKNEQDLHAPKICPICDKTLEWKNMASVGWLAQQLRNHDYSENYCSYSKNELYKFHLEQFANRSYNIMITINQEFYQHQSKLPID